MRAEPGMTDEKALIAAARGGDRAAFGALVRAYQRRAYAACFSMVGNREDALELAQESFVRAFRAMSRFDPALPFYPWLYRIIRNTCLNHLKKRRRRGETSLEEMVHNGFDVPDPGCRPDGTAALQDLRGRIQRALAHMPPEQAEILRLRHLLEFSYAEIAQWLGIPIGTVMSRLHAARHHLRRELEKDAPDGAAAAPLYAVEDAGPPEQTATIPGGSSV